MKAQDIMVAPVITAKPQSSIKELVGIVTRANLVQAIATAPPELEIPASDMAIRDRLMSELKAKP